MLPHPHQHIADYVVFFGAFIYEADFWNLEIAVCCGNLAFL